MGIAILAVTIILATAVVRTGALALELTGVPREMARFQALSAFTGTGFTTRHAEDFVRHPQRRRIISVLIIIGWAGVATIITGLLQTFRIDNFDLATVLRLLIVLAALGVLYRILVFPRLSTFIDRAIKAQLARVTRLEPLEIEEILAQAQGWGIVRLEVNETCVLAGRQLQDSRPRDLGILIMAVERGSQYIPSPGPRDWVYVGDRILAYGPLATMEQLAGTMSDSHAFGDEGDD